MILPHFQMYTSPFSIGIIASRGNNALYGRGQAENMKQLNEEEIQKGK
jgi:hypothetical protein